MVATRGDGWHLAPSLVALINECDDRWPGRSTGSDGSIGDASHAARASDHNPDRSAGGVVRAVDVTRKGIDVDTLLAAVIRDPRVWYVIWNRRIASSKYGWTWERYTGANPHTEHIHISIKHTATAATSTARWFDVPKVPKATQEVPEVITDADVERIAAAVLAKVEPRIQAYARYVTLHEEQTDTADAQRAADATVAALDKRDDK